MSTPDPAPAPPAPPEPAWTPSEEDTRKMALARKQLDVAKINLMTRPASVFISTVAFSLRHELVHGDSPMGAQIQTAGTDARTIWYNVDFWLAQKPRQQLGLLLHEVWHVAFDHCRPLGANRGAHNRHQGGRQAKLAASEIQDKSGKLTVFNPQVHNIACDAVINLMLTDSGDLLPADAVLDEKYRGMSSDEVYRAMIAARDAVPPDYTGDLHPIPGDKQAQQDHREALDDTLVKAAMKAEMAGQDPGTLPGSILIRLENLREPTLPWDRILTRYFTARARTEWSMRRPNRRYFPTHHLPSAHSEALGRVAMAIDLSGSVSDGEVRQFVSDVGDVVTRLPPQQLDLLQFDTKVRGVHRIRTKADLLGVDFTGRGGTNVHPVMDWANEHAPEVLVIFTDGGFQVPAEAPACPVLWVIHDNPHFTADYGQVIHYAVDDVDDDDDDYDVDD